MSDETIFCPFCGSVESIMTSSGKNIFFVECFDCGGAGPSGADSERAIVAWNVREIRPTTHGE